MTRLQHFKSLPWLAKFVLACFTPLAFVWIGLVWVASMTQAVAEFWAMEREG